MKQVAICRLCKQEIEWRAQQHDWATIEHSQFICVEESTGRKLAWDHQPLVFNDYLNEVEKLNTK